MNEDLTTNKKPRIGEHPAIKPRKKIFNCKHFRGYSQSVPTPFGSGNCSEPLGDCAIESESEDCCLACPDYEEACQVPAGEVEKLVKSYGRVLDAVVIAFATTDDKIIQEQVQVAVDQGRKVCRELDRQAKENRQAVKFLEEALPHITCENDFQSGLITAIGTFLQAPKESELKICQ